MCPEPGATGFAGHGRRCRRSAWRQDATLGCGQCNDRFGPHGVHHALGLRTAVCRVRCKLQRTRGMRPLGHPGPPRVARSGLAAGPACESAGLAVGHRRLQLGRGGSTVRSLLCRGKTPVPSPGGPLHPFRAATGHELDEGPGSWGAVGPDRLGSVSFLVALFVAPLRRSTAAAIVRALRDLLRGLTLAGTGHLDAHRPGGDGRRVVGSWRHGPARAGPGRPGQ